jgi:hypothetical protein
VNRQDCLEMKALTGQLIYAVDVGQEIKWPLSKDAEGRVIKLHSVDCDSAPVKVVYEQILICGALEMEWTQPRGAYHPDWYCEPLGMYRWQAESGEKSILCDQRISNIKLANTVFTEHPELLRAASLIGPFNTIDMLGVDDDDFVFPKETILDVVSLLASRSIAMSKVEIVQAEYYDQWPMGEIIAEMSPSSAYSEGAQNWLGFVYQRRTEAERFIAGHPAGGEQFYRIDGISPSYRLPEDKR